METTNGMRDEVILQRITFWVEKSVAEEYSAVRKHSVRGDNPRSMRTLESVSQFTVLNI